MPTDPARIRLTDAGSPGNCPVWQLHEVYSDAARQQWVQEGCTTAGIGCVDCKKPLIESVQAELEPIKKRAEEYERNPDLVKSIIADGSEKAREEARVTLDDVKAAMSLNYA